MRIGVIYRTFKYDARLDAARQSRACAIAKSSRSSAHAKSLSLSSPGTHQRHQFNSHCHPRPVNHQNTFQVAAKTAPVQLSSVCLTFSVHSTYGHVC